MMRPLLALALLVGIAAPATALDAFPSAFVLGEHEARLLVRLPEGGVLRVATDAPARVGLAPVGGAPLRLEPAPAQLPVAADARWHGLGGAVEVVIVREDAARAATVEIEDEAGQGIVVDWPAAPRDTPAAPAPLVAAALVLATLARARSHRHAAG